MSGENELIEIDARIDELSKEYILFCRIKDEYFFGNRCTYSTVVDFVYKLIDELAEATDGEHLQILDQLQHDVIETIIDRE